MKSVAIIGLGWLGSALAHHMGNLGWKVKGTKRTHEGVEGMRLMNIECYPLDLTPEINADPDDLNLLFDVDALIINIPPNDYFFSAEDYIMGIENIVTEALIQNVNHLIFISSTSVFPNQPGEFSEDSPVFPDTDIGQALYKIEQWLLQFTQIDCDIIRFGGLVGEERHPIFHLAGKTNLTAPNTPVNLVHLSDCVYAIQLLLESPGYQRLYHVVSPLHPTRQQYYQTLAKQLHLPIPTFDPTSPSVKRIIRSDKIQQEHKLVYRYPDPLQMLPTERHVKSIREFNRY